MSLLFLKPAVNMVSEGLASERPKTGEGHLLLRIIQYYVLCSFVSSFDLRLEQIYFILFNSQACL